MIRYVVRSTRKARQSIAYLRHLERVGINESPRFLGIDALGREVLTYIEGETAGRPLHSWAADEGVIVGIARLQRRLHDNCAGFVLPAGVAWRAPVTLEGVPAAFDAAETVDTTT